MQEEAVRIIKRNEVDEAGLRRAIALVTSGNTKTVVWNPGPEGGLPDLAADDWKMRLCCRFRGDREERHSPALEELTV